MPSSRRSASSQERSARSGSGGIRASSGQRESASPNLIPARSPNLSAGRCDLADQLRGAGLGGERRGRAANRCTVSRLVIAAISRKRGIRAHVTGIERMFVYPR